MPDTWMSIAEAAASLKVHPRTIERRVASGKIQTRRADDGLLQVFIALPDMPDTATDNAFETVRELAADQITLATGSASAIVKFAQEDAMRARDELGFVRQDVGRARRSALAAWCVVSILGLGATIAVGWTASTITRSRSDVRQLSDYVNKMEAQTKALTAERDNARQEAQVAQIHTAEASARLAAFQEQADKRPTTRPAGLIQRIASVIAED